LGAVISLSRSSPPSPTALRKPRSTAAGAIWAAELAATGHLFRLWRPVGELRSLGIWRATDEAELHEKVANKLRSRMWMTLKVTPLESHPNDPGKAWVVGGLSDDLVRRAAAIYARNLDCTGRSTFSQGGRVPTGESPSETQQA
jgi:muconolactone D-isomerase